MLCYFNKGYEVTVGTGTFVFCIVYTAEDSSVSMTERFCRQILG